MNAFRLVVAHGGTGRIIGDCRCNGEFVNWTGDLRQAQEILEVALRRLRFQLQGYEEAGALAKDVLNELRSDDDHGNEAEPPQANPEPPEDASGGLRAAHP